MELTKYLEGSFLHTLSKRAILSLNFSVKESFLYKKMDSAHNLISDINNTRVRYIGFLLFAVTLACSKFFFTPCVGGVVSFSIFFYVFVSLSILFVMTPLKLSDVIRGSVIIRMLKG